MKLICFLLIVVYTKALIQKKVTIDRMERGLTLTNSPSKESKHSLRSVIFEHKKNDRGKPVKTYATLDVTLLARNKISTREYSSPQEYVNTPFDSGPPNPNKSTEKYNTNHWTYTTSPKSFSNSVKWMSKNRSPLKNITYYSMLKRNSASESVSKKGQFVPKVKENTFSSISYDAEDTARFVGKHVKQRSLEIPITELEVNRSNITNIMKIPHTLPDTTDQHTEIVDVLEPRILEDTSEKDFKSKLRSDSGIAPDYEPVNSVFLNPDISQIIVDHPSEEIDVKTLKKFKPLMPDYDYMSSRKVPLKYIEEIDEDFDWYQTDDFYDRTVSQKITRKTELGENDIIEAMKTTVSTLNNINFTTAEEDIPLDENTSVDKQIMVLGVHHTPYIEDENDVTTNRQITDYSITERQTTEVNTSNNTTNEDDEKIKRPFISSPNLTDFESVLSNSTWVLKNLKEKNFNDVDKTSTVENTNTETSNNSSEKSMDIDLWWRDLLFRRRIPHTTPTESFSTKKNWVNWGKPKQFTEKGLSTLEEILKNSFSPRKYEFEASSVEKSTKDTLNADFRDEYDAVEKSTEDTLNADFLDEYDAVEKSTEDTLNADFLDENDPGGSIFWPMWGIFDPADAEYTDMMTIPPFMATDKKPTITISLTKTDLTTGRSMSTVASESTASSKKKDSPLFRKFTNIKDPGITPSIPYTTHTFIDNDLETIISGRGSTTPSIWLSTTSSETKYFRGLEKLSKNMKTPGIPTIPHKTQTVPFTLEKNWIWWGIPEEINEEKSLTQEDILQTSYFVTIENRASSPRRYNFETSTLKKNKFGVEVPNASKLTEKIVKEDTTNEIKTTTNVFPLSENITDMNLKTILDGIDSGTTRFWPMWTLIDPMDYIDSEKIHPLLPLVTEPVLSITSSTELPTRGRLSNFNVQSTTFSKTESFQKSRKFGRTKNTKAPGIPKSTHNVLKGSTKNEIETAKNVLTSFPNTNGKVYRTPGPKSWPIWLTTMSSDQRIWPIWTKPPKLRKSKSGSKTTSDHLARDEAATSSSLTVLDSTDKAETKPFVPSLQIGTTEKIESIIPLEPEGDSVLKDDIDESEEAVWPLWVLFDPRDFTTTPFPTSNTSSTSFKPEPSSIIYPKTEEKIVWKTRSGGTTNDTHETSGTNADADGTSAENEGGKSIPLTLTDYMESSHPTTTTEKWMRSSTNITTSRTNTEMDRTSTETDGTNSETEETNNESDGTNTKSDETNTESDGTNTESDGTNTESDGINAESEVLNTESDRTKTESEVPNTEYYETSTESEVPNTECYETSTESEVPNTEYYETSTESEVPNTEYYETSTESDRTNTKTGGTNNETDGTSAETQRIRSHRTMKDHKSSPPGTTTGKNMKQIITTVAYESPPSSKPVKASGGKKCTCKAKARTPVFKCPQQEVYIEDDTSPNILYDYTLLYPKEPDDFDSKNDYSMPMLPPDYSPIFDNQRSEDTNADKNSYDDEEFGPRSMEEEKEAMCAKLLESSERPIIPSANLLIFIGWLRIFQWIHCW